MAGELHPLSRSHLLTNPVAEYLETRQNGALGDTAPKRPNSEFVPEMDQFVPKGSRFDQDYHKASRARMQEFQITLQKFHQHMEKRKDKDTSIKLKSPDDYTFKDVLEITTKLHEDHKSASQVRNCMGLIRKLFRGVGENSSILESLLKFVPNDTYGSVICGGFSMILTVLMSTIKGSDYAEDINDAIQTLSTRVDEFDSEARVCDSMRLGQVEENGVRTMIAVDSLAEFLRQMKQDEEALREKKRVLQTQTIQDKQDSQSIRSDLIQNSMDLWLREVDQCRSDSSYIEKCLESIWDLGLKEMDRVKFMMASAELRSWLRSKDSTTLVMESETRPAEVFNALTSSVAIVAQTLISEANFPVLTFFCGLHVNDIYDEQLSGPIGMMNCLNAQLISHFKQLNYGMMAQEKLKDPGFRRKSQVRVSTSLALLEQLFKELSDDNPVVVVIDSACRLLGPSLPAEKAIGGVLRAAARANKIIKMLITDPISTDEISLNTFTQLFIPDYIDGDREGLNLELVQADAVEAASAFKAAGEIDDDSVSTSYSTSNSDAWSISSFSRR
ncbi:hypothetical protein SLS63_013118 [Diaporthe eres]|uniref:Uncharacterized protein n=1 Tax=Diaporthe eres TaxID=83184 RepID=A0ABR1NPE1_DIAER